MKEICTLLTKLYIICSRMQRVNLHARPSIIQVGCTTCSYQVCALDHAKWGTADLDYHSEPCRRNAGVSEQMTWFYICTNDDNSLLHFHSPGWEYWCNCLWYCFNIVTRSDSYYVMILVIWLYLLSWLKWMVIYCDMGNDRKCLACAKPLLLEADACFNNQRNLSTKSHILQWRKLYRQVFYFLY